MYMDIVTLWRQTFPQESKNDPNCHYVKCFSFQNIKKTFGKTHFEKKVSSIRGHGEITRCSTFLIKSVFGENVAQKQTNNNQTFSVTQSRYCDPHKKSFCCATYHYLSS